MSQPLAAPAPYVPVRRPPLDPRAKRGARLAGALGYLVMSLGWLLFSLPIAALAFGAFFAVIFGAIQRGSGDTGEFWFFDGWDLGAWILPLVLCSVVGLAIIVGGLFLSRGILKAHGVTKPWGVTLAGAGIAIVAGWILSAFLTVPFQFAGILTGNDSSNGLPIVVGVVSGILGIVATAATGWLAWWWMAHALRPAASAGSGIATS